MIEPSTIISFAVAAALTTVAPVVIVVVLAALKKVRMLPLLLGAAAFFASQIVVRIPILSALSAQPWYASFAEGHYFALVFLLSLSAGLFEESARLGGALLLKKRRGYWDVISFGLGHAFCEVILLIGVSHFANTLISVIANVDMGQLTSIMPADTLETVVAQLAAATPLLVFWGLLERFSAVVFHLFATVLVFKGVTDKKLYLYAAAVAAHAAFNFASVAIARYSGIAYAEIAILIMALAAGYYVLRYRRGALQPTAPDGNARA